MSSGTWNKGKGYPEYRIICLDKVIIETVYYGGYDPMAIPGIIVKNHGPFAWGKSPANAVCRVP